MRRDTESDVLLREGDETERVIRPEAPGLISGAFLPTPSEEEGE